MLSNARPASYAFLLLAAAFFVTACFANLRTDIEISSMPLWLLGLFSSLIGGTLWRFGRWPENHSVQGFMRTMGVLWLGPWLLATLGTAAMKADQGVGHYLRSAFDSLSMLSTTGVTLLSVDMLGLLLQLWYAQLQWVGGLLALWSFAALFQNIQLSSVGDPEVVLPRFSQRSSSEEQEKLLKTVSAIYVAATVVSIMMFKLVGLSWNEAMLHSFASLSTGGYSPIAIRVHDGMLLVHLLTMGCWLFAGMNFLSLLSSIERRSLGARRGEIHLYLLIFVCASLLMYMIDRRDFVESLLLCASAMTTAGVSVFPEISLTKFATLVVIALVFVGACSASTGGGLKQIRFFAAIKSIHREVLRNLSPRETVAIRLKHFVIRTPQVESILGCFLLLIGTQALLSLVLTVQGVSMADAWLFVVALVSTCNPALLGVDVAALSPAAHVTLMATMLIGRLELFYLLGLTLVKLRNPL